MKRSGDVGTLYLCGTGTDRLRDMTLQTIEVLKASEVIFYIHGDKHLDFFKRFCPDVRSFDGKALAAMSDAARIDSVGKLVCEELESGKKVAYVTYGHPVFFSDGFHMAQYCMKRGFRCRVIAAPSCLDSISALMLENGVEAFAHDVCILHAGAIAAGSIRLTPAVPTILIGVDSVASAGPFRALVDRLEAAYPRRHLAYGVRCRDGRQENVFFSTEIERLRDLESRIAPMLSLAIPGVSS